MALLELTDVGKRFGGLPAVDKVSFTVEEGEILALVGPNGAGKSTLLKAVAGLQQADSGRIEFDGHNVTRQESHQNRWAGIALVMQTPRVFHDMTVDDNVIVGSMFGSERRTAEHQARSQASEALEFVGLLDRADEPVEHLNLHQQRLVELARALAGKPRLLLLDEVMAGLNDSELSHSVDMVRRARDEFGLTVIWVEHVMKAVMSLAERVLVLNFGRLIADGVPQDVMRQPDVVAAYLGDRAEVT